MTTIYDLLTPDPLNAERSRTLTNLIKQEMSSLNGVMSFSRFMELALYHPTLGYYNSDSFTLGSQGDFTTSPEISPVFAKTIAKWFGDALYHIENGSVLEFGAGTGRFAGDVLNALACLNKAPKQYYIYEPNAGLRLKQQTYLAAQYPTQFNQIHWLEKLPQQFDGIIFANEVLDALPVHRLRMGDNGMMERCVSWRDDQFCWVDQPCTTAITHAVNQNEALLHAAVGYETEVNLSIPDFIQSAAHCLRKGVVLFIDYGYGQFEYYRPERKNGTLTCFYKHHHHHDPLVIPGLQDITAHVDFTYVAENSVNNGLSLLGYTTQAGFLLENGLTDVIIAEEKSLDDVASINLRQTVKTLTMPTEMGEIIKVIAFSKGVEMEMPGFQLQDRRRDL